MQRSMLAWGIQVVQAKNSKMALEKCNSELQKTCCKNYFALVCVSENTPGTNAFELVERIRAVFQRSNLT